MQDVPDNGRQRLVRKQILITPQQQRLLRAQALAQGVPEADVVRAALDRELGIEEDGDVWKQQLLSFAGALRDEVDLERTIRENRAQMNKRLARIRIGSAGDA